MTSRSFRRSDYDDDGDGDGDAFSRSTTTSSSISSTPSKVLSDKLDQLDRTWTQHKATSPIPIVRRGTRRRNVEHMNRIAGAATMSTIPYGQPPPSESTTTSDAAVVTSSPAPTNPARTNTINIVGNGGSSGDHESVGSISTLSSVTSSEEQQPGLVQQSQPTTMSVFDRLYYRRQGGRSPPPPQPWRLQQQQRHQPSNSSSSSSRKKNRLGAYQRHAAVSTATSTSVAPAAIAAHSHDDDMNANINNINNNNKLIDTTVTPRRRTTRPLSSSSFLDVPSKDVHEQEEVQQEFSTTFHRLYRNEKRNKKLWREPTKFSPVAAISKQQQTQQQQEDYHYPSNSGPRRSTPAGISTTPVPFETVASTTFDQDLEAIVEMGRELRSSHRDDDVHHDDNTNESISNFNNTLTLILGDDENDDDCNNRSNDVLSPTILTSTSVSSAADTTTPTSTTLDDDVHALELLGKELDEMEASNNNISQGNVTERIRNLSSSVIPNSGDTKQQSSENKRTEMSSSHTRHTDTTADDTYGFFTLDQSSRSYFFAERVDRLSLPFRRRTRGRGREDQEDDEKYEQRPGRVSLSSSLSQQDEPLLTPRRIRTSACVSIQTSWRIHLSELDLTSRMLSTWRTNISVVGTYRQAPRPIRRAALFDAVKIVPCWWILEGFHAERNWVSVAWENEVEIGNTKVLVQVTCDAKAPSALEGIWTERKLAILLVKATLMKSFRGECAASAISRWYRRHRGKLNNSALIIQHWLSRAKERKIESFTYAEDENDSAVRNSDAMHSPTEELVGHDIHEVCTSISTEDAAAVTIQNWFRVLVLKDALKRVPSTANQLRSVLNPTAKPSTTFLPTTDIDMKVIQDVLKHSSIGQRLTAWIDDPDADFVSRRAASLAIQNIVRAYLKGLVIYRRKRKVTKIQAWVRGFLARRRIDELHYAAVIIQFAWSNHRYLDYRKKNTVIIQKFWRRILYQQQYQMSLFCVVLIQAAWRCSLARRSLYSSIDAATKIQSAWRGCTKRRRYLSIRSAVVSTQYLFRKHLVLQQYHQDMYSATVLQSCWRMKKSRNLFSKYVNATIKVQSILRRDIQRRRYQRIRANAIILQSSLRRALARESFMRSVHSAVVLQQYWRAHDARTKYFSTCDSIIRVQSTWRSAMARSAYKSSIQSIVFVQACLRRSMARSDFLARQISAVKIQRRWRGVLGRKEADWLRLQIIHSRATSIQGWWRSVSIRRKYNRTLEKIVKIQAVIRFLLARRYYEGLRRYHLHCEAATSIQSHWRSLASQRKLSRAIKSSITIQATLRGVLARRIYSNMVLSRRRLESDSALVLQSFWRRGQARCTYMHLLSSVVKIQASLRVFLSKNELLRKKAAKAAFAATIIQTHWRASICRDQYLISRSAAILIQARARTLLASRIYQMLVFEEQKRKEWEASLLQMYHNAAIKLQSSWRMHVGRGIYLNRLSSAILIQTIARQFLSRRTLDASRYSMVRRGEEAGIQKEADLVMSVVLIQSQWRGAKARSVYESARVACIIIQGFWRRLIAMKERNNLELLVLDTSANIIQNQFRGHRSRKEYQSIIASRAELEKKAIVIQSLARRSLAHNRRLLLNRRSDRIKQVKENENSEIEVRRTTAATHIQAYWRRTTMLDHFTEIRVSAILIQSAFRRYMCRIRSTESVVKNQAAVVIQRSVRCRNAIEQYRTARVYIVMIQSLWRGMLTRSQWRFIRYLAIEKDSMNAAAREIQVAFVLWKMDNAVWEMKSLAVLLKRGVRGQLVRSAVFFALKHINSSIFPTIVNAYDRVVLVNHGVEPILAWNRALSQARLSACVVIQSYARRMIVRNQVRFSYGIVFETSFVEVDRSENERINAILIQRLFRSWVQIRHERCIQIQSIVRGWMTRQSFHLRLRQHRLMLRLLAATEIQKVFRGWMARQSFSLRLGHHRFLLQLSAATKIQAVWKMFLARKNLIEYTCAVIQIQSIVRGHRSRLLFGTFRRAVVSLQKAFRERKVRSEEQEAAIIRFSAAVRIQALVRGAAARFFVSAKRRRLITQSKAIRDELTMRANRLGAQHVEDLLERRAYSSGTCVARLVDRVHSAIEVSASERTHLQNMASAHPIATKIPVPERQDVRAGTSRFGIITPVRSNKKDLQSTPPQSDSPIHLALPSLAPRNRIVAEANKHIQGAKNNVRQNVPKSANMKEMHHTPAKTRSQSIPLPNDETVDVDTSMPSFDATSPISKAGTSGWDWTDSW